MSKARLGNGARSCLNKTNQLNNRKKMKPGKSCPPMSTRLPRTLGFGVSVLGGKWPFDPECVDWACQSMEAVIPVQWLPSVVTSVVIPTAARTCFCLSLVPQPWFLFYYLASGFIWWTLGVIKSSFRVHAHRCTRDKKWHSGAMAFTEYICGAQSLVLDMFIAL